MPLPSAASKAAQDTINAAFEALERTIAPNDSRRFSSTTLAQVREAAKSIETQLGARGSLRNMQRLMPLFTGLEHYSRTMEVLCNGTPYLPWVWAPIGLVLRVASEYVEAFDVLVKAYGRLGEALPRLAVLSSALVGNADFQQTLAVYYSDILAFHGHAYKFVKRSSWKLFFKTSWGRFQRRFDTLIDNMKRHERLVDWEANAHGVAASQDVREEIRAWREESNARLAEEERREAARQFAELLAWLRADDSDQLAIFEAIAAEGTLFPGTCSWLTTHSRIKAWLRPSASPPLLWVKGAPGSGKSVLAAQLVAFMRTAGMFAACHFCTYSYASSSAYDQILRSLLLQLLRHDQELVAYVYHDFVVGRRTPTVGVLEQMLQSLVANFGGSAGGRPGEPGQHVWLVIDGLDECAPTKQATVVSLMRQLTSSNTAAAARTVALSSGAAGAAPPGSGVTCKVLIASRATNAIAAQLRRADVVSLADEKALVANAIREYARGRLQMLHDRLGQLHVSPQETDSLVNAIVEKADGMFLYARLVLDYIANNLFYSIGELCDSVNQLPAELASFYRDVLVRVLAHLDTRSVDRVKCILGWIAFAKRPLTKLEFLSAVTFSQGDPDVAHLVPRYILDATALLIEERRDTALSFIHVSVKDFIQSTASPIIVSEPVAVYEHGIATVTCLLAGFRFFGNTDSQHDRFLRLVEGMHGFHVYATEHWTEYLLAHVASEAANASSAPSSKLLDLALQLASHVSGQLPPSSTASDDAPLPKQIQDDRLSHLRCFHPFLYQCVVAHLRARSLDGLEASLKAYQEDPAGAPPAVNSRHPRPLHPPQGIPQDGISALLATYQATLGALLDHPNYPGVSATEFERFKSQFRSSVFTCRLASCSRAMLGFETDKQRLEHEMAHLRRFHCPTQDCQYPPFSSAAALNRHTRTQHSTGPPKASIRSSMRAPGGGDPTAARSIRDRRADEPRRSERDAARYPRSSQMARLRLQLGQVIRDNHKREAQRHIALETAKLASVDELLQPIGWQNAGSLLPAAQSSAGGDLGDVPGFQDTDGLQAAHLQLIHSPESDLSLAETDSYGLGVSERWESPPPAPGIDQLTTFDEPGPALMGIDADSIDDWFGPVPARNSLPGRSAPSYDDVPGQIVSPERGRPYILRGPTTEGDSKALEEANLPDDFLRTLYGDAPLPNSPTTTDPNHQMQLGFLLKPENDEINPATPASKQAPACLD